MVSRCQNQARSQAALRSPGHFISFPSLTMRWQRSPHRRRRQTPRAFTGPAGPVLVAAAAGLPARFRPAGSPVPRPIPFTARRRQQGADPALPAPLRGGGGGGGGGGRHNGDEHGSMEVKLGIHDLEHIRQVPPPPPAPTPPPPRPAPPLPLLRPAPPRPYPLSGASSPASPPCAGPSR